MSRGDYRCPSCGGEVLAATFGGGREWYCPQETCEADGYYPDDVLPCFACGRELPRVDGTSHARYPYGATVFRALGNYGSTVYDPPMYRAGSEWLEINICDDCLRALQRHILRVKVIPGPSIETASRWVLTDRQEENDENGEE